MRLSDLYEALCALVDAYAIYHPSSSTIPWRSKKESTCEAILHELVHAICLGDPKYACDIEDYLPDDQVGRIAQELMTLRVERHVYELLERPLSRRRALALFDAADFDGWVVEQERFEASITDEERKSARWVVAIIKAA